MSKIIERNVAEIIFIALIATILLSSCGSLQFGDYNRWQEVNSNKVNCRR